MTDYGFDWDAIRRRYEQGETPSSISRALDGRPSKAAIQKRKDKEEWQVAGRLPVPIEFPGAMLAPLKVEQQAVILQIVEGATQKEAAGIAGIAENTITNWKKSDEEFATAFRAAVAVKIQQRRQKVERSNDTKDTRWLLERDPDSRAEYGAPANIGLQVNRNNIWNSLGAVNLGIERPLVNSSIIEQQADDGEEAS